MDLYFQDYEPASLRPCHLNCALKTKQKPFWVLMNVLSPSVSTLHQDFADIMSQPSLEAPTDSGLKEDEEKAQEDSSESHFLSPAAINTLVQVHQCLCLGYAQSLWYQSTAPANHSKEHMKTLVSSYLIASPLISRFYHLIGQ